MTSRLASDWFRRQLPFLLVLAWAGTAWGNGKSFFAPAGKNAAVDLVYFGNIKDRVTGRPLDFVDVTIFANDVLMTFPFSNDRPGHYRSPDVGMEIKAVGPPVDTSKLEIVCFVEGYKETRRTVPRKSTGTIQVDCQMEKDESAPPSDGRVGDRLPPDQSWRVPALGLGVLLVSGVAVRTSARRRPTRR